MAKDVHSLFKKMSPEARERAEHKAERIVLANRLARLREDLGISQADLAQALGVKQPEVSRIEGREDLKLSTLRRYAEALGYDVEIKVRPRQGQPAKRRPVRVLLSGDDKA